MAKRKSTGKRLRFEIFKRDAFTCQYCGKQPPEAVLVVDHITPVAGGGDDDPMNLLTACEVCNQGKADKHLGHISAKPDADLEWLAMQQEIAELRRYQLAKQERDALSKQVVESIQDTWARYFNDEFAPMDSELLKWLTWASPDQIEDAIRTAAAKDYKLRDFDRRLSYTAGVLRKITGTNIG